MKQHILLLIMLLCLPVIFGFAQTNSGTIRNQMGYKWWDFIGASYSDMSNNQYFVPDANNWPDCPPVAAFIYCEIYANVDPDSDPEDPKPDLATISNSRMKQNF